MSVKCNNNVPVRNKVTYYKARPEFHVAVGDHRWAEGSRGREGPNTHTRLTLICVK